MLTFKSTGKPAKIYHTTPDTKYMPAKLMYGENMATGYDTVTETGETVTLLGDYNKGLVSLRINGKSTQDGTPTPENPVEVESVGTLIADETSEYYGKYDVPISVNDETKHIYLDEQLRGIGNYRDYIDFNNGKVVRRIGSITLDGDEQHLYTFTSTRPQKGYSCYRYMFLVAQGDSVCLCDKIPYKEFGYSVATSGTCISFDSGRRNLIFKIPTEWASTLDELKTWLAANPCTVYYVMDTKTETVLPDSVREELLNINTEYGKTKTLTVTGTDMTAQQCKLNTQEV